MKPKIQVLEVKGELACFARPEMKAERMSYPVITPSAARGVFDAIYFKPQFRWQVTRIETFRRPSYLALRRNEVKEKVNVGAVGKWAKGKENPEAIFTDVDKTFWGADTRGRTQRQTMALKNVHYRLHGEIRPWPGFEQKQQALEAQFRRRAARGQCVWQPYLGCREFPAWFRLVEPDEPPPESAGIDIDVGLMLYDVFDLSRPGASDDSPAISLFRAQVKHGVLDVPDYDSPDVFKPQGGPVHA